MQKDFEKDGYFFNVEDARKEAMENNDVFEGHPTIYGKQICYYNAEERVEGLPENCIWVPLENFYNFFFTTKYRTPKKIVIYKDDFENTWESQILSDQLIDILNLAIKDREKLVDLYIEENKNLKPDFKDEKLRIFIPTSRYTTVMQYVSKAIYEVLKEYENYEVELFIEETEFESESDLLPLLVAYNRFNPHILININHFNNEFLGEDVFNFIWFQDTMPIITNKEEIKKRKRDFTYSLMSGVKDRLIEKGIDCRIQEFCINKSIFNFLPNIKKEAKIVFIGSSYKNNMNSYLNSYCGIHEEIDDYKKDLIINECLEHYKKDGIFSNIFEISISSKYDVSIEYIHNYIVPLVIRDYSLIELVKMNINYKIEIYGWGWKDYAILKPYYKDILEYGEEICKVYNTATYALVAHPNYIVQQRTLESAASNCIPIAYDSRISNYSEVFLFEDNLVLFQNLKELENILKKKPISIDLKPIVEHYSYDSFIKKIIKQVTSTLNDDL